MKTCLFRLSQYITWIRQDNNGSAIVEFALLFPLMLVLALASVELSQSLLAARNVNELARTIANLTSLEQTTTVTSNPLTSYPYSSAAGSNQSPSSAVPVADLTTIFSASTAVMTPFSTTGLTYTVTAVDINNNTAGTDCCVATVRWFYSSPNATAPQACGSATAPPPLTAQPATYPPAKGKISSAIAPALGTNATILKSPEAVIIATVNYTYIPVLNVPFRFAPPMAAFSYSFPRNTGQVLVSNGLNVPGAIGDTSNNSGHICY